MRLLPGIIIVIYSALSLNAQNVSNSVTEFVLTERGFLRGQTDGQVDTFFGIPYAAPPVGDLRWKAPVAPPRWSGIRDATAMGNQCTQLQNAGKGGGQIVVGSEDCLYLNVYRPVGARPRQLLPVLVFVHGGLNHRDSGNDYDPSEMVAKTVPDQLVVNGIVGDGAVVSFQIRGGMSRGTEFLFEIHGERGDLTLTATTRASMQRQELTVRGAQGAATELAELTVPSKYRWVPQGLPGDSRYNVAQLYARLAESIRDAAPVYPSFAAAVTRHRLLDAIVRASETGQKQVL